MAQLPVVDPADFLPLPNAVEALNYETLVSAWKAKFKLLWPDYDVDSLETDPGVIIAEAYAYLRLTDRARINDVYRALRLSLAQNADLDGLAADRGVKRLTLVPATATTLAVMEGDDDLLVRCWTTMQRWSRGSSCLGIEGAAWPLALPDATDIDVYDFPGEGRMRCVLLPRPGLNTDGQAALLSRVGQGLNARGRRPGTSYIDTVLAEVITIDLVITLGVLPGASASAVSAASEIAVRDYFDDTRRIGKMVALSRVEGDACTTNVRYAHVQGLSGDLFPTRDQAYQLGSLTMRTETASR